jgi:hypothetical protein
MLRPGWGLIGIFHESREWVVEALRPGTGGTGDVVVTDGHLQLTDGGRVTIREPRPGA